MRSPRDGLGFRTGPARRYRELLKRPYVPDEVKELLKRPGGEPKPKEIPPLRQTGELLALRLVSKDFNNAIVENRMRGTPLVTDRDAGTIFENPQRDYHQILKMFGLGTEDGEFSPAPDSTGLRDAYEEAKREAAQLKKDLFAGDL